MPVSEKGFNVSVDWKKLFIAITKTVVDASFGSLSGAIKSATDIAGALGKSSAADLSEAEQGWLFVHRTLITALGWTIRGNRKHLGILEASEEFSPELDRLLASDSIVITEDFLDRPADSEIFRRLDARFRSWMAFIKVPEAERERLSRYLAEEMTLALDLEERSRRPEYERLAAFFQATMASGPARRVRNWRRYRARLVKDVRTPLFSLAADERNAVALEDVYVPLRAWWERTREGRKGRAPRATMVAEPASRVVVWLGDTVKDWYAARRANDALRIVSGEPGCGKSSFARMLAADLAREGRRVIYVPLHRYDFQGDAMHALTSFAHLPDELGHDPVEYLDDHDPLLLIFDGLDELSKSGDIASNNARTFVEHLSARVNAINNGVPRLMVLLAGRPVATEESTTIHRKAEQRLHILRYSSIDEHQTDMEVADDALRADQRDQWWRGYFRATNRPDSGLPVEFKKRGKTFDEITAQPLLNYLLALLRDASTEQSTRIDSVHALYTEMFAYIYKHIHRGGGERTEAHKKIKLLDYEIILEEIATAAWHSDDRAVTREKLDSHFKTIDQGKLLERHFGTIRDGVGAILNSFFIQPDRDDMGGCEFTHKSFREYLTARRLVRQIRRMHATRKDTRPAVALKEWLDLTGPVAMDFALLEFLRAEIAAVPADAAKWVNTLVSLFEFNLQNGMPVLEARLGSFREAENQAANAEESLFAAINACARAINATSLDNSLPAKCISINWGQNGINQYIDRVKLLRSIDGFGPNPVTFCLSYINIDGQRLYSDMHRADFSGSSLVRVRFSEKVGAFMQNDSHLEFALRRPYNFLYYNSNLFRANFTRSDLSGAFLSHVTLINANMTRANLTGADLRHADLTGADLTGANFKGAKIEGAKFFGAIIDGANLDEAIGTPAVL